jgi:hypothetical protein
MVVMMMGYDAGHDCDVVIMVRCLVKIRMITLLILMVLIQSNLSELSPRWAAGMGKDNSRRKITRHSIYNTSGQRRRGKITHGER